MQQLRQLPKRTAFKRLRGIEQRVLERSTLLETNMLRAQQAYSRGRQLAARLLPQLEAGQLRLSYPNQQSLLLALLPFIAEGLPYQAQISPGRILPSANPTSAHLLSSLCFSNVRQRDEGQALPS